MISSKTGRLSNFRLINSIFEMVELNMKQCFVDDILNVYFRILNSRLGRRVLS